MQPAELTPINQRIFEFFAAEIKAVNSEWKIDVRKYGQPQPERIVTIEGDINYSAVFLSVVTMMLPKISGDGKTLLLNQTMPNATYFGLDILRVFARFLGYADTYDKMKIIELMHPNHVCTTAVLRLIVAAIGEEACQKIAKKVVEKNPELTTAGLPLVEFTYCFVKAVAESYAPTPSTTSPHRKLGS